jgi:hypothetical protein
MVAAVNKVLSVEKCENTIVSGTTNCTRVGNSIETTIYVYTTMRPILFGDNRGLILAPHNIGYPEMMNHVKRAKIDVNEGFIHNFSSPIEMSLIEKSYTVMSPKEFFKLALPKKFIDN